MIKTTTSKCRCLSILKTLFLPRTAGFSAAENLIVIYGRMSADRKKSLTCELPAANINDGWSSSSDAQSTQLPLVRNRVESRRRLLCRTRHVVY